MFPLFRAIFLLCLFCSSAIAKTWNVGIQSPYDSKKTLENWKPWAEWLSKQLPEEKFEIKTLKIRDFQKSIESKSIDFLIAQPTQILLSSGLTEMTWVASLQEISQALPIGGDNVGSAIWVRMDSPIMRLSDLKNKKISAVAENVFGGFIGGLAVLESHGVLESDLHLTFTDYPVSSTIESLLHKDVDAAIAPLCLYERLVDEKKIEANSIRLLEPKHKFKKNCLGNISFNANWVLASLPHTPIEISKKVAIQVLSESGEPKLPKWLPPQSITGVESILNKLGKHPQQLSFWENIENNYRNNKYLWRMALIAIVFIVLNNIFAVWLARKRSKRIKAIYQDLYDTERLVHHADRVSMLGEMVSGIGHELNQPLSTISYYAEGLKLRASENTLQNGDAIAALEAILEEIKGSKKIIENVRQWGRRPNEEELQKVNISTLLEEIRKLSFLSRNLEIKIKCQENLIVRCDPLKLKQIILNGIINSYQAKASEISINCDANALTILDNGPGFSDEQLAFPFVPFRTSREDGLGIGLVICEKLAQSMDMKLEIENQLDLGGNIIGAMLILLWGDCVV